MKTTATSAQTLTMIRAIANLEFRDLNSSDRAAFSEAPADALIAFAGFDLACAIVEITGDRIRCEGEQAIAVVIAGSAVEAHAGTADGDCVCIGFDLQNLI